MPRVRYATCPENEYVLHSEHYTPERLADADNVSVIPAQLSFPLNDRIYRADSLASVPHIVIKDIMNNMRNHETAVRPTPASRIYDRFSDI